METFIVYCFNKAERDKDTSKLYSFGPFSLGLNTITLNA